MRCASLRVFNYSAAALIAVPHHRSARCTARVRTAFYAHLSNSGASGNGL